MKEEFRERKIPLKEQLAYAGQNGISVDIEGVSYSGRKPEDIIKVMQRGSYMVDYEGDALGNIVAIHIDSVQ